MLRLMLAILTATAILNGANPDAQLGFYVNDAVVTEVDNDVTYVVDCYGEEWTFTDADYLTVGDVCTITFCDNSTNDICDDIITDVVKKIKKVLTHTGQHAILRV